MRWLRLNELARPVGLEPAGLDDAVERRVGQARLDRDWTPHEDATQCESEIPYLVTLDQAAAAVCRSKRTLERYKTSGELPAPTVEGGGGRPDLWDWSVIQPWLTNKFDTILPDKFPANIR